MVDSIKPTNASVAGLSPKRKPHTSRPTTSIASTAEQKQVPSTWDKVERRISGDRRKQRQAKDAKFEMRRNKGRRKTDRPHPLIQTEV